MRKKSFRFVLLDEGATKAPHANGSSTVAGVLKYHPPVSPVLRHGIFAWLGMRPVLGQHTAAEHQTLIRLAAGRSKLVEIGVAEGVSAIALRDGMKSDATLVLIDPFHLSRFPTLNFTKRAAQRAVESGNVGTVEWIEKFSHDAARDWADPIDLLFIDGDHAEAAVERDWNDWNGFVTRRGIAIFHDARVFDGGWSTRDYGPVRFVDKRFRAAGISDWSIVEEIHSLVVVKRR